ncbi:MAG: GNAT family N-acetyltransferase [Thermomicrobiales bacterium]
MGDTDTASVSIRTANKADFPACESILRSLPDWFGIPASVEAYAGAVRAMQTIVAVTDAGEIVGFLTLDSHNPSTIEIHVMAVVLQLHRTGVGRALINSAVEIAMRGGYRLLEVKTLGPSDTDRNYAATRCFYEAMGFLPVEEIDGLWPGNPCLIMVKVLDNLEIGE